MSKPYEMLKGGMYHIIKTKDLKYPAAAFRPTKNSVGLAYTQARSGHGGKPSKLPEDPHKTDIRRLNLFGALDNLLTKTYKTEKIACKECGCKTNGKLRLKK